MIKRKISMILAIIMVLSLFQIDYFLHNNVFAATSYIKWNRSDTLDTELSIVGNKAGEQDILLELQMNTAGSYELKYFLEDSRRTVVNFSQQHDQLVLRYKIEEANPDIDNLKNITPDLISNSFLEMDYTVEIPDWRYITDKGLNSNDELEYTIARSAGSRYPGVAFNIDGKRVIIKWDFQSDKVYFLIDGYNKGNIMPVSYKIPSSITEEIKILKALEDFEVTPTHWKKEEGVNKNIPTVLQPGDDKPGSKPGINIKFKQPKELNNEWQYTTDATDYEDLRGIIRIGDLSLESSLNFDFNLNKSDGSSEKSISNLPDPGGVNSDVEYSFDSITQIYSINIVKDKSDLDDKESFIQWSGLESSSIYNIDFGIQHENESKFGNYLFATSYKPVSGFAYTYMEYELKRANMTEAYLDIKPYDIGSKDLVEYSILYSMTDVPLDINDHLWVRHFHSNQIEGQNVFIPIPFSKEHFQDIYQVVVDFTNVLIRSQRLNYKAKDDLNVPPTTPRIESIDNLYVIPSEDLEEKDPQKVQFDLTWSAPTNRIDKELDTIFESNEVDNRIYYEVLVNDVPTDTPSNPFQVIKVFEVYKDTDGKYKLRIHESLSGNETPAEGGNYSAGYNSIDELFRMEKISIFENGEWTNILETVATENSYTVNDTGESYDFEFPGVNYIRVRAITKMDGNIGVSYSSIPTSLSLSLIKHEIPIVDIISYKPLDIDDQTEMAKIELRWQGVDTRVFEEAMLIPTDKMIDKVNYGVYISQDKEKLLNLKVEDSDLPEPLPLPYHKIEPDASDNIKIDETALEILRSNEIVYFDIEKDKTDLSYIISEIEGLDKNTNYNIVIVTKLEISDTDGGNGQIKVSKPSKILSITTSKLPEAPDDDEIKPLAVTNLNVDFLDDSMISAKISWNYPNEIIFSKDKFAFEVLSIEDKALPDALKSSNILLEDLVEDSSLTNNNVEAWRIVVEEVSGIDIPVLKKYNPSSKTWDNQDSSLFTIRDNYIEIIDPSNTPNKVYYYYVRTINITGDTINSASSWQMDTLTTAPVKAPINLTVSYDSGYSYDSKTESIIRFDAPIPVDGILGTEYLVEIHIMGEEDLDYTMTKYPVTFLKETNDGDLGYRRLYYKVSNLKPGKSYSIKVRIEDRTKEMDVLPDNTKVYPKSSYSERIIIRTEFDQGEYDKENKYREYLEYYDLKVKDLEKTAFIVLEKTSNRNVVKYRNNYGLGELQLNTNGSYVIFTEDVKTNIVYLPAEFIKHANDRKVSIEIEAYNQNIRIRSGSVGLNITKAINEKANEILSIGSNLKDYYVKITVDINKYNGTIYGVTPASQIVDIRMDVIGSKELEKFVDERMINELNSIISWRKEALKQTLSKELDKGINEKEMLRLTNEAIEAVKNNFGFSSNIIMANNLEAVGKPIPSLAKSMLLTLKQITNDLGLMIYKRSGTSWQKQDTSYINQSYMLEAIDLTAYVLLPQEINSILIGDKYTQEEINVINKYNLSNIFNSTELNNTNTSLQKYRMISSFARILGAPNGTNEYQYLRNRGISLTNTNLYGNLTREEVLYIHTQVLAKKHNIVLNTVRITDYNIIQDINQIKQEYRQTLIIGANIKAFKLNNDMVNPSKTVNIKEFIELLTKIDKGLF